MWDTALDMEADVMRVPANITYSLALMGVEGVELLGTLDVEVTGNKIRGHKSSRCQAWFRRDFTSLIPIPTD